MNSKFGICRSIPFGVCSLIKMCLLVLFFLGVEETFGEPRCSQTYCSCAAVRAQALGVRPHANLTASNDDCCKEGGSVCNNDCANRRCLKDHQDKNPHPYCAENIYCFCDYDC